MPSSASAADAVNTSILSTSRSFPSGSRRLHSEGVCTQQQYSGSQAVAVRQCFSILAAWVHSQATDQPLAARLPRSSAAPLPLLLSMQRAGSKTTTAAAAHAMHAVHRTTVHTCFHDDSSSAGMLPIGPRQAACWQYMMARLAGGCPLTVNTDGCHSRGFLDGAVHFHHLTQYN
jgi:hypothetical protein